MKLSVLDDDGIIAIVNADKYDGFVNEDWQLDQLLQHFVEQMNAFNAIVWNAGDGGGDWNIEILNEPSERKAFRQFAFPINVTAGVLHLLPFSDLTMAAQFKDQLIPRKHNSDLKILIDNGSYQVTVRQMGDPNNLDFYDDDTLHFEIIFKSINDPRNPKANQILW